MLRADFLPYLLIMAGVTYLLRMVPLVFLRSKIKNRFVISFLHYIPVAVLSVMVVPASFMRPAASCRRLSALQSLLFFPILKKAWFRLHACPAPRFL